MTFIPLLQLTNDRRIDMHQEEHFSEIQITKVFHSADTLLQMEEERLKKVKDEEPLKKRPALKRKKKEMPSQQTVAEKQPSEESADLIDVSALEEARDLINKTLDEVAQLPEQDRGPTEDAPSDDEQRE